MKDLQKLSDRFEDLKSKKSRAQGALKQAVDTLKSEFGIDNAEEAGKIVDGYDSKMKKWREKRDEIVAEVDGILGQCEMRTEGEDDDFDDFDDD